MAGFLKHHARRSRAARANSTLDRRGRRAKPWTVSVLISLAMAVGVAPATGDAPRQPAPPAPAAAAAPVPVGFGEAARARWPLDPGRGIRERRIDPPSQTAAAFRRWRAANPDKARLADRYQAYLTAQGVGDVLPLRQLLEGCGRPEVPHLAYDVPPRELWPNIVPTLAWIRAEVIPAIGPVTAYHAYRNAEANAACGSRAGTHPRNLSVDLVPLELDDPVETERRLCAVWLRAGPRASVGMGFYGTGAIHVDTWRYRSWGPDTRSATSPCPARPRD